jgi:hypothetical protein
MGREAMSVVTGVLLIFSVCEEEGREDHPVLLAHINDWLMERYSQRLLLVQEHFGGSKHPQLFAAGAGFNYFDEDAFADYVLSLPWALPENVVLILQPEEGSTRVFRPWERKRNGKTRLRKVKTQRGR